MQSAYLLNLDEEDIGSSSNAAFAVGRKVGVLLLLQLAAALTLPFILSKAITTGTPAFLTAVAKDAFQVRSAVLLSFVGSALTVYLGITVFPVFRRYSLSAALLFLVACAVSCALDIVQAGNMLSMLAISNRFVEAGAPNSELYQMVGAAIASARRSAHATQLLGIGAWMLTFYITLLRFRLVPRLLAVVGVIGVALQFTGVTLMMLLGYPSIGKMAMPLLPVQILVAVWLLVKGFDAAPTRLGERRAN